MKKLTPAPCVSVAALAASAGGDAWDKIADPDAYIRGMRGE